MKIQNHLQGMFPVIKEVAKTTAFWGALGGMVLPTVHCIALARGEKATLSPSDAWGPALGLAAARASFCVLSPTSGKVVAFIASTAVFLFNEYCVHKGQTDNEWNPLIKFNTKHLAITAILLTLNQKAIGANLRT